MRSAVDRPKSRRGRQVPITRTLLEAVQAVTVEPDERLVGRHPQHLSRLLKQIWDDAGVTRRGMWLHKGRKTWETTLLRAGATETEVLEWAGQKDRRVMLRYHGGAGPRARAHRGLLTVQCRRLHSGPEHPPWRMP